MPPIIIFQQLIAAILAMFPQIPQGVSEFAQSLTAQLPTLYASGADIEAFIERQIASMKRMIAENRDPTDGEMTSLKAVAADEHTKIQGSV